MLSNNKYHKLYVYILFIGSLIIASLSQSACHIYRFDVRQGNEIEQKKLDQLRPRQSKEEVQKILGTVTLDPINPDRLDYYYSLNPNKDGITKQQHIILFFDKQGNLNHYISDNPDLVIRAIPKKSNNSNKTNDKKK